MFGLAYQNQFWKLLTKASPRIDFDFRQGFPNILKSQFQLVDSKLTMQYIPEEKTISIKSYLLLLASLSPTRKTTKTTNLTQKEQD